MADQKVSQLPTATLPLNDNDLFYVVQNTSSTASTSQSVKFVDLSTQINPGGGGGGNWTLVEVRAISSNPEVFTGLGSYQDLLIVVKDATATDAHSRFIEVSDDGGSTWHTTSGDYISVDQTGVATNQIGLALFGNANSAARTGIAEITNWNQTIGIKFSRGISASTANVFCYIINISAALNAFRVQTSTASMTGGIVYIYGR